MCSGGREVKTKKGKKIKKAICYYFNSDQGSTIILKGTEEKDLGVIFDTILKFDLHINSIINKANSVIGVTYALKYFKCF